MDKLNGLSKDLEQTAREKLANEKQPPKDQTQFLLASEANDFSNTSQSSIFNSQLDTGSKMYAYENPV